MMRKIKIFFISIIASIILIELVLRIFASNKLIEWVNTPYQADPLIGYKYVINSEGTKVRPAFQCKYKINNNGFNWDEFLLKKKKGVYRIILIGSSDDTGLEMTDGRESSYARLLQKYFRKNKDKVEVLNFAIDGGFREYKDLQLIKKNCINYDPDLILMRNRFPINDKSIYRTTYKGYTISYTDINDSLKETKKYIDDNWNYYSF